LLLMLAFDYRFGFFTSCPLMLLAVPSPLLNRGAHRRLPALELAVLLLLFVAFWVFFSGSNYTRLQFNNGIRYMSSMFPFLFVPAAVVLARLPRPVVWFVAVLSVTQSWCLAMYRDVERGLGLLEPILRVFTDGFQLPLLTRLSLMGGQYGDYLSGKVSVLPLFVLTAAVLYGIWSPRWSTWRPSSGSARSV